MQSSSRAAGRARWMAPAPPRRGRTRGCRRGRSSTARASARADRAARGGACAPPGRGDGSPHSAGGARGSGLGPPHEERQQGLGARRGSRRRWDARDRLRHLLRGRAPLRGRRRGRSPAVEARVRRGALRRLRGDRGCRWRRGAGGLRRGLGERPALRAGRRRSPPVDDAAAERYGLPRSPSGTSTATESPRSWSEPCGAGADRATCAPSTHAPGPSSGTSRCPAACSPRPRRDLDQDGALDVVVTSWRGDRGVHALSGKDGHCSGGSRRPATSGPSGCTTACRSWGRARTS